MYCTPQPLDAPVQPQWQEELREKFNLHFWSYCQGEFKDPFKQTISTTGNPWNNQNLVLALVFKSKYGKL